MTDIVERLRVDCDDFGDPICGEAADTIEALRAQTAGVFDLILENARLREALKRYEDEADSLRKNWPITHD